ncbi:MULTISPECIES: hypothetical protein [Microbacterium]|uniref:type II secretion system protein n=1 Tax=Microbacterium TaxID=33882 RepID=UPI00146D5726|nr:MULTISPECIES: hypothetical protein [Microbacterium]
MNAAEDSEAGVTLVELIIYVLLVGIILIATTMILTNSINTQRDVTSVSQATNRGQVMGRAIERAVRNALAFEVDATGTQLRVRTSLPGSLACQAFQLTAGQARLALESTALPALASDWTDWEDGVAQDGSTPFFATSGQQVFYTFEITTEAAPVRISGEASTRSTPTGVTAPCW